MGLPVTQASQARPAAIPGMARVAERALSPATARVYASDWTDFQVWCHARAAVALPASPHSLAAYLEACAARLGPSGLRRVLAALARRHRIEGQPWPAGDPLVVCALAELKARAPRPRPVTALATAELQQLLETCEARVDGAAGLAACRDRALLLVSFAAGLRRSELVALDHDDVRFTAGGMTLHLSARARVGGAAEVAVAREAEASLCAVRAMDAWLRRAGIEYGPVFLRVTAAGTLEGRLTGNGVWRILRRLAGHAGLVVPLGRRLSPQALRKGFRARGA